MSSPHDTGRYESIAGAIPDPELVEGSHDSYAKGEVGSIGGLVSDISADLSTLMRQEVALAKAELKQSATDVGKGAGMLAGAGLAGHMLLVFGSLAVMFGISNLIGDHLGWAALIVALLWGVGAAVLALSGKKELQSVEGLPRTTETAKRVPDALKGNEDPR